MAEPSAQEIYMWALLNRARLDPTGEAARYGIDLNEGGVTDFNKTPFTITATSKQPLAWNAALFAVADQHSAEMLANQSMYHNSQAVHQQNLTNAGYAFSWWGENIAQQPLTATIDATKAIELQHQALFVDTGVTGRGHRYNMMLDNFQEVGIGQALGTYQGASNSLVTQDFGRPSVNTQFLTGIAYNDTDGNQFYSIGEGRGGVTVTTTAGNAASGTAGAFSKAINAGIQTISFTGGGLPTTISAEINVTAGRNAMVNLVDTSTLETSVSLTALSGVTKIVGLGNIGLTLTGNSLNNTIVSALGNDAINGADGTDTVVYSGLRVNYTLTNNNNGTWTVSGKEGTDTLTSIEKAQFSDQLITIGAVTPPPNNAPVVAVADKTVNANTTVKIASWVSYSDADNNAATQYQIVDKGTAANSGQLIAPNGTAVAAGTILTVSAADLVNVAIKGGGVAGTDAFEIRAFDGKDWSAWDGFNVTTIPAANHAPVATIDDKSLKVNEWMKVADLLNYSDADGNAAVQYQFIDKFAAAGSAYFWNNGTLPTANQTFSVNAGDLGNLWVRGAQVGGWENMQVRAFDGTDWGAWDTFKITTLANNAPVATINDTTVRPNATVKITDLVKFTDADGDAAAQFQFIDLYNGSGSAHFLNNGQVMAANQAFTVNAADLSKVTVKGAAGGGWDNMQVRAFDGKEWGAWDTFKFTTNSAAVAKIADVSVSKNEWVQASTLLKTTDADGDTVTQYQFIDKFAANGSAYIWNDGTVKAGNTTITVNAADLADVYFRGATTAGWDNMQVRANDGNGWGAWDNFKFTTINNSAPVVTVDDLDLKIGKKLTAKSLFSATDPDAGDAITKYQVFDDTATSKSGKFLLDGKALAADMAHTIKAGALSDLKFAAGTAATTDLLWARAYDGDTWSDWQKFNVDTIV